MLVFGLLLLLAGVASEWMYVVSTRVAYNGPTLSMDIYLLGGIMFILFGFIIAISSVKIPEIHISDT